MAHSESQDEVGFREDGQVPMHRGRTMVADAGHLTDDAADAVRSHVAELRHGAKRAVESAKDRLEDVDGATRQRYEAARDAVSDAAESVKGVVARHPMAAAGVAAGLVVVVGLIVRRQRTRR